MLKDIYYRGLTNKGATCYMNALMQNLFHSYEFRKNIFEWKYDPKIHGQ